MTKKKDKRKKRSSSEGSNTQSKVSKFGGSSGSVGDNEDNDVSVSDILSQTNSVLYDSGEESFNSDKVFDSPARPSSYVSKVDSVKGADNSAYRVKGDNPSMASSQSSQSVSNVQPSNADIMACLKKMESRLGNVDIRISAIEKRLSALEEVKTKVEGFDKELKKLWTVLEDRHKQTDERLKKVEDRSDSQEFAFGLMNDKMISIGKEKNALKDEVVYLQSQSMRNNLIFSNIPELNGESNDEAEAKIKEFIHDKMKVAKEQVDKIVFERVHRVGPYVQGRNRNIVAKFHEYKEKEFVRKQGKTLQGTQFHVFEQFPKDIADKRRKLVPRMQAARREGKRAWISYDTLYIDGKAVRD